MYRRWPRAQGGDGFVFDEEKDEANVPLVFEYDPTSGAQLSVQINKKDVGTKLVSTAPGTALIDVPAIGDLSTGKAIEVEIKEDDGEGLQNWNIKVLV